MIADPGADGGSHLTESQPSHSYAVLFHPYSCPNIQYTQYLKNLGLLLKFLISSQLSAQAKPRLNGCAGLYPISLSFHSVATQQILGAALTKRYVS